MATDKTYDLNNPRDLSSMYTQEEQDAMSDEEKANAWNQMWRNFCVSDTFEPGSPSKVLTCLLYTSYLMRRWQRYRKAPKK